MGIKTTCFPGWLWGWPEMGLATCHRSVVRGCCNCRFAAVLCKTGDDEDASLFFLLGPKGFHPEAKQITWRKCLPGEKGPIGCAKNVRIVLG